MATMNVRALCLAVAIVFSVLPRQALAAGEGSKEADKIAALPGQPKDAAFQQYSGYVNLGDKAGKSLFYYFVEATADPATKPLLLWLNGGKIRDCFHVCILVCIYVPLSLSESLNEKRY